MRSPCQPGPPTPHATHAPPPPPLEAPCAQPHPAPAPGRTWCTIMPETTRLVLPTLRSRDSRVPTCDGSAAACSSRRVLASAAPPPLQYVSVRTSKSWSCGGEEGRRGRGGDTISRPARCCPARGLRSPTHLRLSGWEGARRTGTQPPLHTRAGPLPHLEGQLFDHLGGQVGLPRGLCPVAPRLLPPVQRLRGLQGAGVNAGLDCGQLGVEVGLRAKTCAGKHVRVHDMLWAEWPRYGESTEHSASTCAGCASPAHLLRQHLLCSQLPPLPQHLVSQRSVARRWVPSPPCMQLQSPHSPTNLQ